MQRKYPQKIILAFIEPMCQMQENYRCLTPNPIRAGVVSPYNPKMKTRGSQSELDNIASLLLL